jgi:hypothetical protein
MVWAGYRAKLNHLVLSVLDGAEKNVPAFRVDGVLFTWCGQLLWNASQSVQGVRFLRGLFRDENPQVMQLLYEKILPYIHQGTFVAGL